MKSQEFGGGQGYFKGGFQGFQGAGKTHTATLAAIEVWKRLKNPKARIAMFDTETGGEYVNHLVKAATGQNLLGIKSRALIDLLDFGKECVAGAAPIMLVDSITHVWREVCAAYLLQVNKALESQRRPMRTRLEFQDWSNIKERWNIWTTFYLNSPLHIPLCGRAGYEYDFEEHTDDSGKVRNELVKTGVKMKVEGEFGYEPSLLIHMSREQVEDPTRPTGFRIVRRAEVLKDRFDEMDGQILDNPTGASFAPHLDRLRLGVLNTVDVEPKTPMNVDERGNTDWQRERRQRTILCEKIQGAMVETWPGQSASEKKAKVSVLGKCFGTTSWTEVENMNAGKLAAGLAVLETELKKAPALPVKAEKKEE